MEHGSTPLFHTRRVFAALVGVCIAGVGLVQRFGAGRASAPAASVALGVMALLCAALAFTWRDQPSRPRAWMQGAGLVALGALTAPPAWFFGINSAFAGVLALVLVTAGLLGDASDQRQLFGGAVACATTMFGQAVMITLVFCGVLPDDSMQVVEPPGHPLWHHAISHLALQGVYVSAFFIGRGFRKRYARVATELDEAVQLAVRRDAQVEEARAAYQRALSVAQHGILSGATLGDVRLGGLVNRADTGEVYRATNIHDGTTGTVRITRGAPLGSVVLEPGPVPDALDPHAIVMSQGPLRDDALRDFVVRVAAASTEIDAATAVRKLAAATYHVITAVEPGTPPLDPRLLCDVSDDVVRVLQIGLATVPADRFADVGGFASALAAALGGGLDEALRARAANLPAWSAVRAAPVRESTERIDQGRAAIEPPVAPVVEPPPPIATTSQQQDDQRRSTAWQVALRDKLRRQRAGVLALCAGGAVLLAAIARQPEAWWAAELGIAGIALVLMMLRDPSASWPWPLIAALGIGPAYAFGLHSGFASVIALLLFAGGAFRPATTIAWHRHGATLLTILVAHAATFAAIALGFIPDAGNTPTSYPTSPPGTGAAIELLGLAQYATAFVLSRAIDVRFAKLVRRNEMLARTTAHQEVLLATARADLERATAGDSGGLFTGSVIGGYTVATMIGRGGMGEVYEAERNGGRVALKLIRADRVSNPDNLRLFSREATTLRRVRSPYVAQVVDVGTDAGVPFMAMELVAGSSLSDLLRESDRMSHESLRRLIHDVTRGLEDVHRAGVLHLDIKPANLVLTAECWKVIDFGIAELVEVRSTRATDVILGTPAYMAPEQIDGARPDARTDLFSFSAVIYRALTGRQAWTAANAFSARTPPVDPCRLTGAPLDVGLALRLGLATAAEDRFASATELASAFEAAFGGRLDPLLRRRARQVMLRLPWSA